MSKDTDERMREKNAAWWAAHPDFKIYTQATAESLAFTTVHWIHNYESSLRYGERTGDNSGPMAPVNQYTARSYAILTTKAWLIETQKKLDTSPEPSPENWYGRRDLEMHVRNLQLALDTFEWNDKHREPEKAASPQEPLPAATQRSLQPAPSMGCMECGSDSHSTCGRD